ncbi:MAG: hypothetical protein JSR46_11465 [Verrucomicrobia bacterium]|nr:hypothetical protein [Verrucomicrobiota bacterium]
MAAYSIASLANDILPVLTKISREAFKNPLTALSETLPKELLKLTVNKVVGVYKLTKGLLTKPVKTVKNMGKAFISTPKTLLKNIKSFCGIGKSDHKKAKQKAKRQLALQLEAQKNLELKQQNEVHEVFMALPGCLRMAKQQWLTRETTMPEAYLQAIFTDWKKAVEAKKFAGSCGSFIGSIHYLLIEGHFSDVVSLSPTAHASSFILPQVFSETLAGYAESNLTLSSEVPIYRRQVTELSNNIAQLTTSIGNLSLNHSTFNQNVQRIGLEPVFNELQAVNVALRNESQRIRENAAALGNVLNMTTDEAAELMNLL